VSARLAIALLAIAACKSSTSPAPTAASDDKFWPEAPKPTSTSGTRSLAYKPESFTGYVLTASGGTPAGAEAHLDFAMTLALEFAAGAKPRERDASIAHLDLSVDAPGNKMSMKLDHDAMTIDMGGQPPMTVKRGDTNGPDIAGMTDRPFTTLVFGADNTVAVHVIPDHPWVQLGAGDMLDDTLVLFPDMPKDAVAPGYKWSITRNTAMGGTGTRVDVKYDFEYIGDGPCPSGAKSCAQIRLTGATKEKEVHEQGITANVTLEFAGKIFFDTERGAPDESREHMKLHLQGQGVNLSIDGTFALSPTK